MNLKPSLRRARRFGLTGVISVVVSLAVVQSVQALTITDLGANITASDGYTYKAVPSDRDDKDSKDDEKCKGNNKDGNKDTDNNKDGNKNCSPDSSTTTTTTT
ncbi:MAG: hypothetical protein HQ486_03110, partial [Acidimicrobiaceae bacterium]|nr:hypothetical protein [Acidimicrobiaceae bacterium]